MGTNNDYMEYVKKTLEIIPSLPVDAASLAELRDASRSANNIKDFAYMELLKEVEASVAARAPKGFENELEYIHRLVYPLRIVQPGERPCAISIAHCLTKSKRNLQFSALLSRIAFPFS